LPTLRRPGGGDDGGARERAKVGGLLADPPAKKAQRKSAVTSPTIRVVVDELIPETGEDPLSARATLVSSVDSASLAGSLAARDDNDNDNDNDDSDDDKSGGGGAP
jgi:hypothetical protein